MESKIEVGGRYRDPDDGEIVRVERITDDGIVMTTDDPGNVRRQWAPYEFRRFFTERLDAPAPAPTTTVGACYRDPRDGEIVRVISVDPIRTRGVNTDRAETAWLDLPQLLATYSERVADPTPAIAPDADPTPAIAPEPDDEDHKPRGVKAPLSLIPWEVVPDQWTPEAIRDPRDLSPERVIRTLLETQGDDLLFDAAFAFGHGAEKYGVDNWRGITWNDSARREDRSAMLRHLYADAIGEKVDPDSGLPHLAHALASAMIYAAHERAQRAKG